jgi:hypothetical protein
MISSSVRADRAQSEPRSARGEVDSAVHARSTFSVRYGHSRDTGFPRGSGAAFQLRRASPQK